FFFFQAEDGIRDFHVTGVQTCALPIWDFAGGAAGDHPYASSEGFSDFSDEGDLFSSLFGRGGRMNLKMRGQDVHYRLPVEFLEAVNGATRRITLSDGSTVDVTVPPAARDGQLRRHAGEGGAGIGGET